MAARTPLDIPAARLAGLRRYNAIAGVFHLVQAIAIIVLSNGVKLPLSIDYLMGPPAPGVDFETVAVADVPVALLVGLFSLLSAIAHFWIVGPGFARYATDLAHKRNFARWVEYSISSTIMIVLISMLNSIWNVIALLGIIGCNVSMILFGWLQEKYERPGSGGWLPFIFGCIAGIVPWLIVVFFVIAPGSTSDATPPGFVYGIIVSLFVFFNVFAVVQFLQYKPVGRWADYLTGEKTYIVLSLVAKSALAWQIFAGTLIPAT